MELEAPLAVLLVDPVPAGVPEAVVVLRVDPDARAGVPELPDLVSGSFSGCALDQPAMPAAPDPGGGKALP